MENIIKTERGWAGHFCASHHCGFRRNTLIECGDTRIVVSTVGNYRPPNVTGVSEKDYRSYHQIIGHNRYYETMAFVAKYEEPYWEADVRQEVDFESNWSLDRLDSTSDKDAQEMHEVVVNEICKTLTTNPPRDDTEI